MPVVVSWSPGVLHPVRPWTVASQNGFMIQLIVGLEKTSAMIMPTMMARAALTTRLRSSRRWSIRGIRPSGLACCLERT